MPWRDRLESLEYPQLVYAPLTSQRGYPHVWFARVTADGYAGAVVFPASQTVTPAEPLATGTSPWYGEAHGYAAPMTYRARGEEPSMDVRLA